MTHLADDPEAKPINLLQNIWVWRGRPDWNAIFMYVKEAAMSPGMSMHIYECMRMIACSSFG